MARFIVQGNWSAYSSSNRPHQPVYALLLTPEYMFGLNPAAYTFVLHTLLACGTIYLVYAIARRLFGPVCGLSAAFLVAVNLMIALWFPWTSGDAPFHFFFALFALSAVTVWEEQRSRNVLVFLVCAVLCVLSRPEGLFVAAAACMVLAHRILRRYLPLWKIVALLLAAVVLCAATFTATLYRSKALREAFFSSMVVAYPLFISTRMSTNSPQEQIDAYNAMGVVMTNAARDPGLVSPRYALSMEGLRFIRGNPLRWTEMYVLRLMSVVFPSVFSPWWSVRNRVYSFSLSLVLVAGSVLGCASAQTRRYQAVGLSVMGLTIVLVVSLFQREVDERVPLSMDVMLSCVAPFG